jgi:hypothetical protein
VSGHCPHSPSGTAASPKCLYTVALLKAVTMPLWVQIPESLPTKVCPPTYVCLIKRNPCIPVRSPQQRRNLVSVMHNPCISTVSLLRVQRCGHTQEWLNRRGAVDCASRKSPPLVRPLVGWSYYFSGAWPFL